MTAWEAIKQAPRKLGEVAARPQLVGITSPPRRMSSLWFGITMVTILVGGLIGVLVLSTALQTREFELRAAQRTANELGYQVSDLESQVNRAKAPLQLGRRATDLGMVPNPHSVFIDLGTGQIKGEPVAANGGEIPSLRISPPAPTPAPDAAVSPAPSAEGQPGADPAAGIEPPPAEAAQGQTQPSGQPSPGASNAPATGGQG